VQSGASYWEGRISNTCVVSGDGWNLGLPHLIQFHFRQETSGTLLELAVFGGVDERVDDAVAEHQHSTEVVVPASEVGSARAEADGN